MENELKNPSRNFRSEKFVSSEFLVESKMAFMANDLDKARQKV